MNNKGIVLAGIILLIFLIFSATAADGIDENGTANVTVTILADGTGSPGAGSQPLSATSPPEPPGGILTSGGHELIIITPQEFYDQVSPLKEWKDRTGMPTTIWTLEEIYAYPPFNGYDAPEEVKNCIWTNNAYWGTKYVLLVGDCDKFPVRYVKAYNTQWGSKYYPSDLYYADIYTSTGGFDDWDGDNDHIYGEMDFSGFGTSDLTKLNLDGINMYPDVAVGRVPASSAAEVTTYVNKVINYETNAHQASWEKRALWMVDNDWKQDIFKDRLDGYMTPHGFTLLKRYYDDYSSWTNDQRKTEFVNLVNSGVGFVNVGAHGGQNSWQAWFEYPTTAALNAFTNQNMLPIVWVFSCGTADFDFNGCGCTGCVPQDSYWTVGGTAYTNTDCGTATTARPEPAPIQPSAYDIDSLSEQFTVKRATGGVAYIGVTEVSEHGGEDLDKYFFEGYHTASSPIILGDMWNYGISGWLDNVDLWYYYAFHHMHKTMLFGDPSLRVEGVKVSSGIGLFRPSTSKWYLDYDSNGASNYQVTWGASTDVPISGDWDNDGNTEIGLWRPSSARWYLDYDNNGLSNYQVTWGASTDKPVTGDWDNDGYDEIGLWRPSTARWYLDYDNNGLSNYQVTWGASTDKPVTGDWDNDGYDEIGLWRPSTARWYLDYDNNGLSDYKVYWGAGSDNPVSGAWT